MSNSNQPVLKSTTVLCIKHNNVVSIGADGQATLGNTVAKSNVKKIRKLAEGKVIAGFAGSTADAFTLLERFEEQLNNYQGNLKRAAVELAKAWRTDRFLRRLESMMIVTDGNEILTISGNGDVLEPEDGVASIGSGSMYALSAGLALKKHAKSMTAKEMVNEALTIAARICIYTNDNFIIEELNNSSK